MTVVDSHVHVASPAYPTRPTGVGTDWWRSGGTVDELIMAMDAANVAQAVVVQAVGPYGYDCRCACDAVASAPERLALVVAVDMAAPDPARDLTTLAATAPAGGVRVFGVTGAPPRWLADGRADDVWAMAASLGIPVVATLFSRDLPALGSLVDRHPGVAVAVDHCGFPEPPGSLPPQLLALADRPAVHLKVTTQVLHHAADPTALVVALAAAFGADRLAWGSDYPQSQGVTYSEMVAMGQAAASGLDPVGREAFLAGTAARLWFGAAEV